jgi:hypothetical protein
VTPPKSAASHEELLEKKKLVEQRLREKERRVSRLSMALGRGGGHRQNEVDKMAEKLRRMQTLLERSEQTRIQEDAEEERRREEERRLQRLTRELEKAVDPNAMTKSQKQRRTQNMMNLMRQMGGKITEEALESLEATEREQDEKERRDRRERMEATERRLKEINVKIRDNVRVREEQNVIRLQRQLELMEGRLHALEAGSEANGSSTDEEDDEEEMRQWEEQMRQLRTEREKALQRRKAEMERRLRELQEMVEEKRREREEKRLMLQQRKVAALEHELHELNNTKDDDLLALPSQSHPSHIVAPVPANSAEFEQWMQRIVEERLRTLEEKMRKKQEDNEEYMRRRLEELRQREERLKLLEDGNEQLKNLETLTSKLSKIDQLEQMYSRLDAQVKAGAFGGGGGEPTMTTEELKKQIEEMQRVIFDPNSSEKQIADANIQLEKLMLEYEKSPEYRQQKEEKRLANEKLNKAALERVKAALRSMTPEQLKQRLTDNPELKLVLMEPNAILKMHQNDFKNFAMRGLSIDEVRALRGCVPTFRKDQRVQVDWVDSLEAKIDEMAANAVKPPPAKPKKEPKSSAKKWKKPLQGAAAKAGDIFAELLARKGGGLKSVPDDSPSSSAPSSVSHVPVTPPASAPRPPPPPASNATNTPPPPRPPLPPSPAIVAGGPPPPPPPQIQSQLQARGRESFLGKERQSRMMQPLPGETAPTENDVKAAVDNLVQMVFSGASEADVVTKCKALSEQIKSLAGDHKELAPKARFLIMAVKEAMTSRNGTPDTVAYAKQKLVVVVNSLKRALEHE